MQIAVVGRAVADRGAAVAVDSIPPVERPAAGRVIALAAPLVVGVTIPVAAAYIEPQQINKESEGFSE